MAKTSLLILHGWRVPRKSYFPLKKLFLKAGLKVFLPQLPGFDENTALSKPYSLNDYTQFVIDFAKKNKLDRFFLIGHSFGGRVAINFAASYPERVKGLVLTGVPAIRQKFLKRVFFLLLAKIGRVVFSFPPFSFFRHFTRKILYFWAGERDYYRTKGSMRKTFKNIVDENLEPLLVKIKTPTLLCWGKNDKIVSSLTAKRIVSKISQARLAVVPEATHKLPYEEPEIFFNHCLDFFDLTI